MFYFYGPALGNAYLQYQINFSTTGAAIKTGFYGFRTAGKEVFYNKTFPTAADDGMSKQAVKIFNAKQCVDQAAVANVYLRRFNQTFTAIAGPWLQATNQ